jgi:multidrug transporter EmrE-like cation transporter
VIVLLKLMVEYCQLSVDIPNLCFDIMTRLLEIFKVSKIMFTRLNFYFASVKCLICSFQLKIFNSKTYQMILGVGAIQLGILKIITFKTLAITFRCLELVLIFLPLVKEFFKEKLPEKHSNLEKQFTNLIQV